MSLNSGNNKIIGRPPQDVLSRFNERYFVCKETGCWIWTGSFSSRIPYGRMTIRKKEYRASHISYELFVGEIPKELLVCHHCDNTRCVNPEHLFIGTALQNTKDMIDKGRAAHHEKHPRAKLKISEVKFIRETYKSRCRKNGTRALARRFSVSQAIVSDIINNKIWRNV